MNRVLLLPGAYFIDQVFGDPEWLPHPVRLIGLAIARGEDALRRPNQTKMVELISGATLTFTIVTATYWITEKAIQRARVSSDVFGNVVELLLGWTCLAARNLEQEANAVTDALTLGNLTLARQRLARIVGRDTMYLDASEIRRAVIETVAESASDGVVAPLIYMAVGGVPLAMAYKAINTLDSMIGHADQRYLYFGKTAAHLDDLANYLPARLTALSIVVASQFFDKADAQTAWQTWHRDGDKHKSPNAGQPESAIAGALHVRLGGKNIYAGEVIATRQLGQEFPLPTLPQAKRAIRLVSAVSLIGLALGVFLTVFVKEERAR